MPTWRIEDVRALARRPDRQSQASCDVLKLSVQVSRDTAISSVASFVQDDTPALSVSHMVRESVAHVSSVDGSKNHSQAQIDSLGTKVSSESSV